MGYGALTTVTLMLVAVGLWNTGFRGNDPLATMAIGLILLLFLKGIWRQWNDLNTRHWNHATEWTRQDLTDVLAVTIGSILTFWLQSHGSINVVVASAVVGLAGVMFHRSTAIPVYCGSFAGMASAALFDSLPLLLLASALSGLFFAAAKTSFQGFGGKLGTTAFAGSVPTALLFSQGFEPAARPLISSLTALIVASMVAAVITYYLQHRQRWHAVTASAAVGLVAGLFLSTYGVRGSELATMAFCASFIGMANRKRLAHEGAAAIAGAMCALLFAFTAPYFVGAGGKLGTTAFAATVAASTLFAPSAAKRKIQRWARVF